MYEIILILLIILCFSSLIYFLYKNIKIKRKAREILEEKLKLYNEKKKQEFDDIEKEFERKINYLRDKFNEREAEYNKIINQTKAIIQEEEEKKNLILSQKQEIINKELNEYKIKKEQQMNDDFRREKEKLETEFKIKTDELINSLNNFNEEIDKSKKEKEEELIKIIDELKDYRLRRAAVNEAIMREKEIQEKENFYKINITENDIEDINILESIRYKIKNREALNKLIYDVYISKPAKEMIKRVLNGNAPSGIYKITYLPTGEAYIGKSTNIKNRWEQHCKACFGLGNISHSSLHTKMARDGIWNFSFELLEEVPKENLTEREKYYIKFYDTVKFGMNEKVG